MSNTEDEPIDVGKVEVREYCMTPEEFQAFKDACNPRIMLVGADENMMRAHAQQRARAFWKGLGEKYGFDPRTTAPVEGKHMGYFRAVAVHSGHKEADDAN